MQFTATEHEKYTLVEIDTGGAITPDALFDIHPPKVRESKGVILSGRAPVWLFGYLVHHYHPCVWVATYDPRLEGAVIVESHTAAWEEGEVVSL